MSSLLTLMECNPSNDLLTEELGGNDRDNSNMMTIIVALSVTLTLLLLAFAVGIIIFCVIKKR